MTYTKSRLILAILVCLGITSSTAWFRTVAAQTSSAPGGFVESTTDLSTRPLLSASQIAGFLPQRGLFTFPAPYGTQGIRLTNSSDCGGGDCVMSMGYSYWRRINNHVGSDTLYAVLTLDRNRGGGGPTLFSYNKVTGATTKVGPLFDSTSGLSWAHGEMFYFSATRPTAYYIHDGPKLMRYDVLARTTEVVFDVTAEFGADKYLWQPSSSDDDRVHAFTLRRDGDWATLGCAVYDEGSRSFRFFAEVSQLDECQVDKSGRFVVIKDQVNGADGEDNVIVDLATGAQRVLLDPQGAGGHSDLGHGYMVAEDNWNQLPGSSRLWRLDQDPSAPGNGRLVFHATDWNWGMNHITHTNARAGVAPEEQIACSSETTRSSIPRGNEVICYKLDGSLKVLVVAPIMTNLDASGGGDDYYKAPKGNLDVTGDYFIWTSNMGGSRLDAFIVKVPKHLLGGGSTSPEPEPTPEPAPEPEPEPEPTPAPTPEPTPTPVETAVTWTSLVHASASGGTVTKTSGCNGCPDAGALSVQEIAAGDGYLEFTMSNARPLRYIGLSNRNPGTTGSEISFALRLQKGIAEIREHGVYRGETRFAAGDALRIAVTGGVVTYAKNGKVFHTSGAAPSYPLVADVALYDRRADISLAAIGMASAATSSPAPAPEPDPTPAPAPSTPTAAVWTSLVHATVSGETLWKSSGCEGCGDSGGVATQYIAGSGFVEFTIDEVSRMRSVGLAAPGGSATSVNLPWALRLQAGYVEVRESEIYRADSPIAVGDVLRISVSNGIVSYARNGTVFYTSAVSTSSSTLAVYARLNNLNASVAGATIGGQ